MRARRRSVARAPWLRRGALALSAASLAAVTVAAPVLAAPTGDPATVALFRAVSSNTNLQPALQIVQSGYMTVTTHPGTPTTWSYRWGYGLVPEGYGRATETITYVQSQGKVVWITDLLTPAAPACPTPSTCRPATRFVPIELFITAKVAFAGLARGPHAMVACFDKEPFSAVPYRAGGHWWAAVGDFRPMVQRGNHVLVTDTYSWADGQHVTEVDSINLATRLFVASGLHVSKGSSPGQVAFGFSQRDSVVTPVPHAPAVTVCP